MLNIQADVNSDNFLEVKVRDRKSRVPIIIEIKEDWIEVIIQNKVMTRYIEILTGSDNYPSPCSH